MPSSAAWSPISDFPKHQRHSPQGRNARPAKPMLPDARPLMRQPGRDVQTDTPCDGATGRNGKSASETKAAWPLRQTQGQAWTNQEIFITNGTEPGEGARYVLAVRHASSSFEAAPGLPGRPASACAGCIQEMKPEMAIREPPALHGQSDG